MYIRDLPERAITVGTRVWSVAPPLGQKERKKGTIINKEPSDEDAAARFTVRWDDCSKMYFYGNACDCEIIEQGDDVVEDLMEKLPHKAMPADPVVSFLYVLLRDHLPAGVVLELVALAKNSTVETTFTNGYLADYAVWCAEQLEKKS